MLDVDAARTIVLEEAWELAPKRSPLLDALGCALAEDVVADADLPPFDKALMDGFAVRASDCGDAGEHRLSVGEEITAGGLSTRPLGPREAAVIMTGAPMPVGADAVIMHEKVEEVGGGYVRVPGPIATGLAVLARGRELRGGQVLFRAGTVLNPARLGVLASVGRAEVRVVPRPVVAIVPTGDELVAVDSTPGPGKIRESNSVLLAALVEEAGGRAVVRPPAPDEPTALNEALASAFRDGPDIVLTCGGVSAGKMDLVPPALAALGVETRFHSIRLKPGKPLLFGILGRREPPEGSVANEMTGAPRTLIFGLPGNPVSGLVGFLLFVEPAIRRLRGHPLRAPLVRYPLMKSFRHRGDRPTFHPARLLRADDLEDEPATSSRWPAPHVADDRGPALGVAPVDWAGSSDLYAVARADGFARFEAGDRDYDRGESVPFLPLSW